jgi:hypothetical protein
MVAAALRRRGAVAAALLAALPLASGHGAIVFPPSRNAVDGELDPWAAGVPYPVIFNSTTPVCRGGDAHGRGARCTLGHATYNAPQWCPVADPSKDDHIVPYDNHGLSGRNGQVRRARTAARATPCVRKTVTRSRCSPRSHPCALFRQACYWFS